MFEITKQQLEICHEKSLMELLTIAGSISHLAKMLKQPKETVQSWLTRKRISTFGVKLIEKHPTLNDRILASRLRPDLY